MIVNVFSQPYELLVLLYGGLLAGLVYEFLRFFRLLFPRKTGLFDLLFLFWGSALFCFSLLQSTKGVLRWYTFGGFGGGMLLSKMAFRKIFTKICQKIRKNQYQPAS